MEAEQKQKIDSFVTKKFTAERERIDQEARLKASELPKLGVGNSAYSKYADDRHVRIQSDHVNALVLKRTEILLEAYDLYDAVLDEDIIEDARHLRDTCVAARSNAVAGELNLEVMRNVRRSEHAKAIAESFKRHLTIRTHNVLHSRLIPRRAGAVLSMTNGKR